jgi:putative FmdB family regulatory protein
MPTYDYKCTKCGNEQEEIHQFHLKPEIKCIRCNEICERLFTTSGFVFKGDGSPSQNFRMKDQMNKKSQRMKTKMFERESSGEGVTSLSTKN